MFHFPYAESFILMKCVTITFQVRPLTARVRNAYTVPVMRTRMVLSYVDAIRAGQEIPALRGVSLIELC